MIFQLDKEYQLRGYAFENIARMLLRRQLKNNFIFQVCRFNNIHEIINKYRFRLPENLLSLIKFTNDSWKRFDIIEFCLKDKTDRIIEDINFYEVKTKYHKVERKYYEFCKSNYLFYKNLLTNFKKNAKIVSIVLFENWRFSINIYEFTQIDIRVYSNFKNKEIQQIHNQ